MHLVRVRRFGIPQQSRDRFALLVDAGLLPPALGESMKKMVGFRNVAVHAYHELNIAIVQSVVEDHLTDFEAFATWIVAQA